jgi:hypothetical protein
MMEEQKETVGFSAGTRGSKTKGARVDKKPALSESGTDKNPADRARKAHAMPRDAFEALRIRLFVIAVTAARSPKRVRFTSSHTWRAMMSILPSKNPLKDELRYNELDGVTGGLVVIAIIAVLIAMPIPCWTILFLLNP